MKKPEEMLKSGTGNFLHCTDYEDAIEAMKEYGKQCLEEGKAMHKESDFVKKHSTDINWTGSDRINKIYEKLRSAGADYKWNDAEKKEMEDLMPLKEYHESVDALELEYLSKWCAISLYLENELDKGKTEFRLFVNADKTFYIHHLNKDGKTFDGEL